MDYWNRVLWSDETKINFGSLVIFGSDGVKRVWRQPGEEYKDYSQAWWWECHGLGLHECCRHWGEPVIEGTMNANMYCDILKQSMIPSLRRLGCRAVFQNDNDPKHTSKTTTALLKKLRVKVICGA